MRGWGRLRDTKTFSRIKEGGGGISDGSAMVVLNGMSTCTDNISRYADAERSG